MAITKEQRAVLDLFDTFLSGVERIADHPLSPLSAEWYEFVNKSGGLAPRAFLAEGNAIIDLTLRTLATTA